MKKKSLRSWIKENRKEIDVCIQMIRRTRYYQTDNCKLNDEERRLWILNDEGLYNWARSEKVNV